MPIMGLSRFQTAMLVSLGVPFMLCLGCRREREYWIRGPLVDNYIYIYIYIADLLSIHMVDFVASQMTEQNRAILLRL